MYPSAPQSPSAHSFKSVVRIHSQNGYAETVIIDEDDETFYARQKERLQKAHPELSLDEVEKTI